MRPPPFFMKQGPFIKERNIHDSSTFKDVFEGSGEGQDEALEKSESTQRRVWVRWLLPLVCVCHGDAVSQLSALNWIVTVWARCPLPASRDRGFTAPLTISGHFWPKRLTGAAPTHVIEPKCCGFQIWHSLLPVFRLFFLKSKAFPVSFELSLLEAVYKQWIRNYFFLLYSEERCSFPSPVKVL